MCKICLVIPNYNHSVELLAMREELSCLPLPVLVIDDGSTEENRVILRELEQDLPKLSIMWFDSNCGKGAAVTSGLERAHGEGFSHVLQVDADGQHDLTQIAPMCELVANHPDAVIAGVPVFDRSIPAHRKLARYLTHFWVCVNTLSREIKDSMCGFRVYPLDSTIPLVRQVQIGTHMDFDIEIIVRLFWQGVRIVSHPVRVCYPEESSSNFRPVLDNARISWMHAKLFFGMLKRLPVLLSRRRR